MPPKEKQMIDLNTLDPQQLSMLKKEFEEELNGLMRSTMALQKAAGEFGASGQAVEALQEHTEGKLPLKPAKSQARHTIQSSSFRVHHHSTGEANLHGR